MTFFKKIIKCLFPPKSTDHLSLQYKIGYVPEMTEETKARIEKMHDDFVRSRINLMFDELETGVDTTEDFTYEPVKYCKYCGVEYTPKTEDCRCNNNTHQHYGEDYDH